MILSAVGQGKGGTGRFTGQEGNCVQRDSVFSSMNHPRYWRPRKVIGIRIIAKSSQLPGPKVPIDVQGHGAYVGMRLAVADSSAATCGVLQIVSRALVDLSVGVLQPATRKEISPRFPRARTGNDYARRSVRPGSKPKLGRAHAR